MATYVISDLHGCKTEFDTMLRKIQFSYEEDELWIIGDICDRGPESIPLLQEIMAHKNMHLIFGNHDVWLARYCQTLIDIKKKPGSVLLDSELLCWLYDNGGLKTADQFMDLSFPECYDIKLYLEDQKFFQRLTIHGKHFLLVHAGIPTALYIPDLPLEAYNENILVWSHIDIDDNPFPKETMIVGHCPTFTYGYRYANEMIKGKNIYHIDCGCVYGYSLGCLRLDDMKEFYVPRQI